MDPHRDPATIRHLLSVDPGTELSAWALWRQELVGDSPEGDVPGVWRLDRFNQLVRPTPPRLRTVLDRVLGLEGVDRGLLHLVVELQWLGTQRPGAKHHGAPHQAVLQLAVQRAHWEACAACAGVTYEGQDPRWVLAVTKGAPMAEDLPARARDSERRLAWVGRRRWPELDQGERRPTKDEWAAIMLGTYWLQRHGQQLAAVGGREAGGVEAASAVGDDDGARRRGAPGLETREARSTRGAPSSSEAGR